MEWSDDILTAAQVTNWQEFRDLFATEIISPHENVTVGSQIVLFTDLRGSTAMYNEVGDAPAYVLVRNHFYVLTEAIREHHGAIVKTIGDAVMAVFSRVDEAFAAVRQMHEKLPQANPDAGQSARLQLKSSLHIGPCLAVNANDKLDFFGSTINLAARMVACCQGDDLTISDELYQRPETIEFLKTIKVPAESSEVKFRGFESSHKVWRIPMK
jgi:class 3 adenylate cyclase